MASGAVFSSQFIYSSAGTILKVSCEKDFDENREWNKFESVTGEEVCLGD